MLDTGKEQERNSKKVSMERFGTSKEKQNKSSLRFYSRTTLPPLEAHMVIHNMKNLYSLFDIRGKEQRSVIFHF